MYWVVTVYGVPMATKSKARAFLTLEGAVKAGAKVHLARLSFPGPN